MKKLSSLKGAKTLSKQEQKSINGGSAPGGLCPSGQIWCPTCTGEWFCSNESCAYPCK